jgi:hypothetical protein
MKQCPVCKSTYTDDSLSFCLNDGAALTAAPSGSEVTQQMSFGSNPTFEINPPIRVNVQSDAQTSSIPTITTQTQRKGSNPLIILTIVGLLAIVGIAAVGGAYFVFVRKDNPAVVSTPLPAATTSPIQNSTPDQTQALKDELEKLKKQVNDQKNKKTDLPASNPTPQSTGTVTARVNSPGDGFLSLRTEPSVKTGVQLVKIPTGAIVQMEDCQRNYSTTDTKRGRWCMVTYNGQTGWAFDAFLIY